MDFCSSMQETFAPKRDRNQSFTSFFWKNVLPSHLRCKEVNRSRWSERKGGRSCQEEPKNCHLNHFSVSWSLSLSRSISFFAHKASWWHFLSDCRLTVGCLGLNGCLARAGWSKVMPARQAEGISRRAVQCSVSCCASHWPALALVGWEPLPCRQKPNAWEFY